MTDLHTLPDNDLDRLVTQLERKVEALRFATTALGTLLHERYRNQLDAVRAEQERRRT
jgi:hypothetical protein